MLFAYKTVSSQSIPTTGDFGLYFVCVFDGGRNPNVSYSQEFQVKVDNPSYTEWSTSSDFGPYPYYYGVQWCR